MPNRQTFLSVIQISFLNDFIKLKLVSYNKNDNRNINFNIIRHISTDSIYITLAQGIIYDGACTPNLDVVKVTQACCVGMGAEPVKAFTSTHHLKYALQAQVCMKDNLDCEETKLRTMRVLN